jgi:hypothetical protein
MVYTADLLTLSAIERLVSFGVPVNAGSEDMLTQLGERRPGAPRLAAAQPRLWSRPQPHGEHRR